MNIRYTAEVTDPLTGTVLVLEADSPEELEHQLDDHLQSTFPDLEESDERG